MTEKERRVMDSNPKNLDVCAEIIYEKSEGIESKGFWPIIHSDVCMIHDGEYEVHEGDDLGMTASHLLRRALVHGAVSDSYREFLHKCLDEWLDNSNGTGMFWIGDPKFAVENFKEGA